MKFSRAIRAWLKDIIANHVRYFRAVCIHPSANIMPRAWVGKECNFGKNVTIYSGAILKKSRIGDYSYVGGESILQNCKIGRFTSIGPRVRIGLGVHPTDRVSTFPGFYSSSASGIIKFHHDPEVKEFCLTYVGNDVWIGAEAMIMDGVKVGDGAVIGARAVVTSDVAPYQIVAGVPARVIRSRFSPETIDFLNNLRWWERDENWLLQHAPYFSDPETLRNSMKI